MITLTSGLPLRFLQYPQVSPVIRFGFVEIVRKVLGGVENSEDGQYRHRAVRVSHAALLVVVVVDERLNGPVEVSVHFPQRHAGITVAAHHSRQGRIVWRLDCECIRQAPGRENRNAPNSVVPRDWGNHVIADGTEEDV